MRLIRSLAWWMNKSDAETETVGAASPRSKKTLSDIELTDEDKKLLRSLSTRDDGARRNDKG